MNVNEIISRPEDLKGALVNTGAGVVTIEEEEELQFVYDCMKDYGEDEILDLTPGAEGYEYGQAHLESEKEFAHIYSFEMEAIVCHVVLPKDR